MHSANFLDTHFGRDVVPRLHEPDHFPDPRSSTNAVAHLGDGIHTPLGFRNIGVLFQIHSGVTAISIRADHQGALLHTGTQASAVALSCRSLFRDLWRSAHGGLSQHIANLFQEI